MRFHWSPYAPVDDVERFTDGDCHILARAIHRHTGWTFCTFTTYADNPDAHAFVQRPDGLYVDVQGVADEATLLARWKHTAIRRWDDFDAFAADWPWWAGNGCAFGLYSYLRADQLARKIAS